MNLPVIIIPAFNEEKNIAHAIQQIKITSVPVRIVVVDDGSTDKTVQVARSNGVTVFKLPKNQGKAYAVMAGIKHVLKDYDPPVVVLLDADLVHINTASLRKLIGPAMAATKKGTSKMVVGSSKEEGVPVHYTDSGTRSFSKLALARLAKLHLHHFERKIGFRSWSGYGLEHFLNFYFENDRNKVEDQTKLGDYRFPDRKYSFRISYEKPFRKRKGFSKDLMGSIQDDDTRRARNNVKKFTDRRERRFHKPF